MVGSCSVARYMVDRQLFSLEQCSISVADSSTLPAKKMKRKRKSYGNEQSTRPLKSATREVSCSSERKGEDDGLQWRNLELCLAVENSKDGSALKKVELVHTYLSSLAVEENHDADQTGKSVNVSLSRLIVRLNSWIQSLLISSEDKMKTKDKMLQYEDSKLCLDCRCWEILRYCLQESAKLGFSPSLSGNLLRVIGFAARNAVPFLNDMSLHLKDSMGSEEFKLYRTVYDCIRSMFALHNGVLNGSMDSWMAAVSSVLELVIITFARKLESSEAGSFFIGLACSTLEPFSKFLRIQRWRKNGFRDFVDNLLEPLFHLLGLLHDQSRSNNTHNLLRLVEEIISCGLFHASHIDEFLNLQALGKYSSSSGEDLRESKTEIRSYHRHLFEKLQDIVSQKKKWELHGTGELFRLFVSQLKKLKRELFKVEGLRHMEGKSTNHMPLEPSLRSGVATENNNNSNSSLRKSSFDFLVQIMEPLLFEIKHNNQSDVGMRTSPLNAQSILRSINKMLYGIKCEKMYVRTEDITGGACINFLKVIYDLIISFSAQVIGLLLSSCDSGGMQQMNILALIAEELVVAVGYMLDIEHKVIGEGLVDLWLMILAFLAAGQRFNKKSEGSPLISRTVELSCQVVNLFKELREASHAVVALCRGLRYLSFSESKSETKVSAIMSVSLLYNEVISKSAELLMCSRKFRMNIHEALKTIPEGQASEAVHALVDLSKSLDWTKVGFSTIIETEPGEGNSHSFTVHAELLGKVFSEIYILVLDSIPLTAGNSSNIGDALNGLITFMQPIMSSFIASAQYRSGLDQPLKRSTSKVNMLDACHWIFLFFFRLYVSCRSLFQQAISLLPPHSSLKKSAVMGNGFTGYSGMDLMESDTFRKEGYISCISQSPTSFLALIQSIRQNIKRTSSADYSSLAYMLHPMVIQRLVDLNRQMNFVQYVLQESSSLSRGNVMANDRLVSDKKVKNWKSILSDLEEEVSKLTAFIMKSLSLVDQEEIITARTCVEISNSSEPLMSSWDMCVCSLDEKALPAAVWWIICQNVAVWCIHAAEEDLESFLSILIRSVLCYDCSSQETGNSCSTNSSDVMKVTVQQISLDLLQDASFYELTFVRRYLATNICHALLKFNSFPKWVKALKELEISYIDEENRTVSFLDNDMEEFFKDGGLFPLTSFQVTVCQNLLNLLIRMPKQSLSTESFLHCTRFVLNLERVIVRSFVETYGTSQLHGLSEFFKLLVCCRQALKCLITAFCDEKTTANESSGIALFGEKSHVLWLLKSVAIVVEGVNDCSSDGDVQANRMVFSLMDYTSCVFMILAKYYRDFSVQLHKSSLDCTGSASTRKSTERVNAYRTINMMAKFLRDQLNDTVKRESQEDSFRLIKLNKTSSLLSCTQGFLWGLAATLNDIDAGNCVLSVKRDGECKSISKINQCVEIVSYFMDSIVKKFLIDDGHMIESIYDAQGLMEVHGDKRLFRGESSVLSSSNKMDNIERLDLDSDSAKVFLALTEFDSASEGGIWKKLQGFFGCQNYNYLFFIREMFTASSAILRLRIQTGCSPLPSTLMKFLLGILREILLDFANMEQVPKGFWYVLDGALQFMEELGYQYASSYLTMTRNVLVNLVSLHFKAIGKCISLEQKIAKLSSHEMESSTKTVSSQLEGFALYGVEELKARLRMSFKMLIKNSSHLESAISMLEKALAGVQEGCTTIYEVTMGKDDGGMVSSTVAAGVDCLDLVLECVEGRKPVKEKLQTLTASLFNIVVHLQGPSIFYGNLIHSEKDKPDPGSVVLMCVEVLTRISRKDTLFQTDVGYQSKKKQRIDVGQFLRLPAALFHNFCHLIVQNQSPAPYSWTLPAANASDAQLVDQHFSIDLYAASCRLLCTVVKHRHSESVKKTGLLQYSVEGLLNCLEIVDTDSVGRNSSITWTLEDGIKCACYLRRVYEEIRQQKLFKEHCFKFLSNYISVFSGFGPLRKGLKREIDEAMRPGVYALIDACSEQNLQCLHTEFGEGPCRSILASLRHDYKLHFQYHGKV